MTSQSLLILCNFCLKHFLYPSIFFEIRMKIKIGHLIYIYTYIKYFVFRREMSKKFRISDNTKSNVSAWIRNIHIFRYIFISNANSGGIMHQVNGNINHKIIIRILKLEETFWTCLSKKFVERNFPEITSPFWNTNHSSKY